MKSFIHPFNPKHLTKVSGVTSSWLNLDEKYPQTFKAFRNETSFDKGLVEENCFSFLLYENDYV